MSDEILIAGLGDIGISIAMALRHAKLAVRLVGYDPNPKVSREALKTQVVDRIIGDLRESPAESDLFILSQPPDEVIPALERLVPRLAEGALVLGIGPLQSPVLAWCTDHLPAGRNYIGAVLVEGASAAEAEAEPDPRHDRFSGGVMGLVFPTGTPQSGIDVAVSLARLLGARAFFLDPGELDAASATTEGLPLLLAAALMHMSTGQPGWRDMRRLTGRTFVRATALLADIEPKPAAQSLALSRAALVAKMDAMISELSEWRTSLASGDEEATLRRMSEASEARLAWLSARRRGDWEVEETRVAPSVEGPGFFERMFGFGSRRGKKGRS